MSLLKINPDSIDATSNYAFNKVTVSGIDLLQYTQAAYEQANTGGGGSASYYQNTTPVGSSTGSLWTNSDTGLVFVNVGDANTATWIEFGPSSGLDSYYQNTTPTGATAGSLWTNTDTGVLYENFGDIDNTVWVEIGTAAPGPAGAAGPAGAEGPSNVTSGVIQLSTPTPFVLYSNTVSADYTIPTGYNALSAGPITIQTNNTVTISNSANWVIV